MLAKSAFPNNENILINSNPNRLKTYPTSFPARIRTALFSLFVLGVYGSTSLTAAYPEKPIKVIVPTNAGGETDGLTRLLQRAIAEKKLLPEKMVVVNLPGAGGTLGTRKIKQAEPDGYTIGLWHSGIVTSKAMGIVDYDHNDFELICMTGYTELLLGVTEKSRFESIEGLLDIARADPRSVKVSTNVGLPVHLIPLLFAEEAGVEFRFIQTGGGSPRLTSLLGGHSDMTMLSTMAFVNFRDSGLKPLVTFSGKRDPMFPEVPTAKEIGIDVELVEIRVWLAPKGTPEPVLEMIRNALESVMTDPKIAEEMKSLGVVPEYGGREIAQPLLDVLLEKVAPLVGKARNMDR
ncbi:MAG: tripartite tricarboxylate transporter substrate binding protein [Verrucomicrobia bacterium]|nr:tripartite tricarboxylate transporter substrate binding protein [Verrucomicrobiota bacterium]